ncbi:hypothetical protein FACS189418_8660 [Clostridia bacterium]|nr:hypothetical protein FACS189418_8660 [Clostridia bacterium]
MGKQNIRKREEWKKEFLSKYSLLRDSLSQKLKNCPSIPIGESDDAELDTSPHPVYQYTQKEDKLKYYSAFGLASHEVGFRVDHWVIKTRSILNISPPTKESFEKMRAKDGKFYIDQQNYEQFKEFKKKALGG